MGGLVKPSSEAINALLEGTHATQARRSRLVGVEAHFPVGLLQRPDVVVRGVGGDHQALAAGFDLVDHVARGMTESGHARDARGNAAAIIKEGDLVVQRLHVLVEAFVRGTGPVVVLDPTGDIAG